MKRVIQLLAMLFWATSLPAQTDIVSPWRGPFGDLGRNLKWGVSGAGGMNNAFVINVPEPQEGACLFIRNLNNTAGHSFKLRAYITSDQQALGYYATPGAAWTSVNVVAATWTQGVSSYFVDNALVSGGLAVFSVAPASGAKVAFVISDSTVEGGTDTANIFYTFGSPSPCSALIPPNTQIFVDARTVTPGAFTLNLVGSITPGAFFPGAPQTWRACSFYLYADSTGAAGTLNTYISSYDSFTLTQDDRVSFQQFTADGRQAAHINFETNAAPHTAVANALTAGTLQYGTMSDAMRVTYVVTGAGAAFNVNLIAICH